MTIQFPQRTRFALSCATRLLSAGLLSVGLSLNAMPAQAQFKVPTPKVPTPKVPTPKVPTPKVPTPKVPTPKAPTPKVPTPKPPKVPTPKVPTPKVPTPKVQLPKTPDPSKVFKTPSGNSTQFSGGGQKTKAQTSPPNSSTKKPSTSGPTLGNTAPGEPIRTKPTKTNTQPSTSTTTKPVRPGPSSSVGAAAGGAVAGGIVGGIIGATQGADRPPTTVTRPVPQPQREYEDEPREAPRSAPPRNNVVTREPIARLSNAQFQLLSGDFDQMEAEFAGRQVAELGEAGAKIDAALAADLDKIPGLTAEQQKEMIAAWRDAVLSGDPEAYQKFKDKFGALLPPAMADAVDARLDLLQLQSDILDGKLEGLGERLQKVAERVEGWAPSLVKDGVRESLTEAIKFHELGQLATLARQREDAIQILIEGIVAAGFEPELLAEASGLPIVTVDAASDTPGAQVSILLLNPDSTGRTVHYQLDGNEYSMQAGHKQVLTRSRRITIVNDNGGEDVEYDLSSGVYEFVRDEGRWDVSRIEPRVVIDNTRYRGDFHYTVNGESVVVPAGEAVEHSSDDALVIEFDRGDDSPPARKVFGTGHYVVGIDAAKQRLDLYDIRRMPSDAEDETQPAESPQGASQVRTERRAAGATRTAEPSTANSGSSKSTDSRRKDIDQVLERLRRKTAKSAPSDATPAPAPASAPPSMP